MKSFEELKEELDRVKSEINYYKNMVGLKEAERIALLRCMEKALSKNKDIEFPPGPIE